MSTQALAKQFIITSEQHTALNRFLENIQNKVNSGLNGNCPYDPEAMIKALDDFDRGRFHYIPVSKILKLVSDSGKTKIKPVDGSLTFKKSKKEVFKSGVVKVLKKMDCPDAPTSETSCQIYKLQKDAKLSEMFFSISKDLYSLCFSQHQIIEFCRQYMNELNKMGNVLFLCRYEKSYILVSTLKFSEDKFYIMNRPLESNVIIESICTVYIVVPSSN